MENTSVKFKKYVPNSLVIVLTNPIDVMIYVCLKETSFPRNRAIEQSGILLLLDLIRWLLGN